MLPAKMGIGGKLRVVPKELYKSIETLEGLTGLSLTQGFTALFMATDKSIEEILSLLISDLPPGDYVGFGYLMSEYLNCNREYILTNHEKVQKFLEGNFKSSTYYGEASRPPSSHKKINPRSFEVPSFVKGKPHVK